MTVALTVIPALTPSFSVLGKKEEILYNTLLSTGQEELTHVL